MFAIYSVIVIRRANKRTLRARLIPSININVHDLDSVNYIFISGMAYNHQEHDNQFS